MDKYNRDNDDGMVPTMMRTKEGININNNDGIIHFTKVFVCVLHITGHYIIKYSDIWYCNTCPHACITSCITRIKIVMAD